MLDVWYGDLNIGLALLILSIVVVLPVQVFLCFKAKNRAVRLLPLSVFGLLAVIFVCISIALPGWDGLGYTIFAIYAAFMVCMCGIGWGVWVISKRMKKK